MLSAAGIISLLTFTNVTCFRRTRFWTPSHVRVAPDLGKRALEAQVSEDMA